MLNEESRAPGRCKLQGKVPYLVLEGEGSHAHLHGRITRVAHEFDVSWDDVANSDNNDISRNQLKGLYLLDLAITESLGTRGQSRGQGLDGLVSIALLHVGDGGIGEEEPKNEPKVCKVEQGYGDDTSDLHCPGQRIVHVSQVHQERISSLLWQLVGSVLLKPLRMLCCGESFGRALQASMLRSAVLQKV